jgi:hypothetical protein
MESTGSTTSAGTVLTPRDDLLYEVVDGQVVELAPMGAYEIRIATVLRPVSDRTQLHYRQSSITYTPGR